MERSEQIEALCNLLSLEKKADKLSKDIKKIENEKYRNPPLYPERPEEYKPNYPTMVMKGYVIPLVTVLVSVLTYIFLDYRLEQKYMHSFISNPHPAPLTIIVVALITLGVTVGIYLLLYALYTKNCAAVEADCREKNRQISQEYNEKVQKHEEFLVQYKAEKEAWKVEHNKRIDEVAKVYNGVIDEINAIYNETKLIPLQYRKPEVVSYLYDYMTTSEADIQQGLISYDNHVQQQLVQSRIKE